MTLSKFQESVLRGIANSGYEAEAERVRALWLAGQSATLTDSIGGTSRLRMDFETANQEVTRRKD